MVPSVIHQLLVLVAYLIVTSQHSETIKTLRTLKETTHALSISYYTATRSSPFMIEYITSIQNLITFLKNNQHRFIFIQSEQLLEYEWTSLWNCHQSVCAPLVGKEIDSVYWDPLHIDSELKDIIDSLSNDAFKVKYAKFNELVLLLTDPNVYGLYSIPALFSPRFFPALFSQLFHQVLKT